MYYGTYKLINAIIRQPCFCSKRGGERKPLTYSLVQLKLGRGSIP